MILGEVMEWIWCMEGSYQSGSCGNKGVYLGIG